MDINENRIDLICSILKKMAANPSLSKQFQVQMSKSLTIAEACLFARLAEEANDGNIEALFDGIFSQVSSYVDILEALGIPVAIPQSKMNAAQLAAIDEGLPYLEGMNKLRALWAKANKVSE